MCSMYISDIENPTIKEHGPCVELMEEKYRDFARSKMNLKVPFMLNDCMSKILGTQSIKTKSTY